MNCSLSYLLIPLMLIACAPASPPTSNISEPTNTAVVEIISATETQPPAVPTERGVFTLTSTAFINEGIMPNQYAYSLGGQCNGENIAPQLAWSGIPSGTQTFAILLIDPDGGNWVHWLQFNIPADVNELPEFVGGADVGIKGRNDFGELGYGGPCPPSGTHRYVFTLFALDIELSLSEGATQIEFMKAIEGHVLGEAELIGLKSRE